MRHFIGLASICACCCVVFSVRATLIKNGGFESPHVDKGAWNWFSAYNVGGWQGSNLEIWNGLGRIKAFEGKQHAELNAHPFSGDAFSIYQSFDTLPGRTYSLGFAYRARQNSQEAFKVALSGQNREIWTLMFDDHTRSSWTWFCTTFDAISSKTTLTFTSTIPSKGTAGNLLDAVEVFELPPAPGLQQGAASRVPLSIPGTLSLCLVFFIGVIMMPAFKRYQFQVADG